MPEAMPPLVPVSLPVVRQPGFWRCTFAWLSTHRRWRLEQDWTYTLPDGTSIVLPAGFVTDGASAPRLLWPLIPPSGPLLVPSLVHDFAYRHGYLPSPDGNGGLRRLHEGAPRRHWDWLFHELARIEAGHNLFTLLAGPVMRLFGWHAWRRHRHQRRPGTSDQAPPHDQGSEENTVS